MGGKTALSDQLVSSTCLKRSKEEAREAIKARIRKGRELSTCQLETPEQLEKADADETNWHKYNIELLKSLFNDEYYAKDYRRGLGGYRLHPEAPFEEIAKSFRKHVEKRVNLLEGYLQQFDLISECPPTSQDPESEADTCYVDLNRIDELRSIASEQYDFAKLVRLCEELNRTYANDCFFATAMLTRAVLDHVSPIFGYTKFSEVANNYDKGGKSFKQSVRHLEQSSRCIADAHLHVQIRKSETLPNRTQVNFSNDLDVLLAEIVRIHTR